MNAQLCKGVKANGEKCQYKGRHDGYCKRHMPKSHIESGSTITITFGDRAENHTGMQIIGEDAKEGFSNEDLVTIYYNLVKFGMKPQFYDLQKILPGPSVEQSRKASIIVIPNMIDAEEAKEMFSELVDLDWDKKAFMRGRVVNKKARYNLIFSDCDQEPEYQTGKGRIINIQRTPLLQRMQKRLPSLFGEKASNLVAEGNYYYDNKICGIGYHGDAERKITIGLRLGNRLPLYFRWYQKGKPCSPEAQIMINSGSLYIMSNVALGRDWKKRNIMTLRHAAGWKGTNYVF